MATLLAIDPGITASHHIGNWLPDSNLLKKWVHTHYGPVTHSLAYVTRQPHSFVGTDRDDGSDPKRLLYSSFLEASGFSSISHIFSTPSLDGSLKCNVDTTLIRDISLSLIRHETHYSPITGYYPTLTKGPYDTFVGVMGDWDIVRPLLINEQLPLGCLPPQGSWSAALFGSHSHAAPLPTLLELGIKVVIMYKQTITKYEILQLARDGLITFIPLEDLQPELTRGYKHATPTP